MPRKVTQEDLKHITPVQFDICPVCNGTGQAYVRLEKGLIFNKVVKTTEPQPCYKCQQT